MPLGFPVVPEVYRMNSGCSAGNASGVCWSDWVVDQFVPPDVLVAFQSTSMPVRRTTRTCSTGESAAETASSTAAFSDTAVPRRYWPSAVITTRAWASPIRERSASAENPAKTTPWASPSRAQASIANTASGIIGR